LALATEIGSTYFYFCILYIC